MKEDKVIELGYEFGIDSGDECFEFGKNDLQALINHVEQATLERAAKKCEEISNWRSIWDGGGGASHGAEICRQEILALKDSND